MYACIIPIGHCLPGCHSHPLQNRPVPTYNVSKQTTEPMWHHIAGGREICLINAFRLKLVFLVFSSTVGSHIDSLNSESVSFICNANCKINISTTANVPEGESLIWNCTQFHFQRVMQVKCFKAFKINVIYEH